MQGTCFLCCRPCILQGDHVLIHCRLSTISAFRLCCVLMRIGVLVPKRAFKVAQNGLVSFQPERTLCINTRLLITPSWFRNSYVAAAVLFFLGTSLHVGEVCSSSIEASPSYGLVPDSCFGMYSSHMRFKIPSIWLHVLCSISYRRGENVSGSVFQWDYPNRINE